MQTAEEFSSAVLYLSPHTCVPSLRGSAKQSPNSAGGLLRSQSLPRNDGTVSFVTELSYFLPPPFFYISVTLLIFAARMFVLMFRFSSPALIL